MPSAPPGRIRSGDYARPARVRWAPIKAANLVVRFTLEIVTLVELAYWGVHRGGAVGIALAVAAPVAAAAVWGRYAAPRSRHRLSLWPRTAVQAAYFAAGIVALAATGATGLALVVLAAVIVNGVLVIAWDQ